MASYQSLSTHPALHELSSELRELVSTWVEDLAKAALEPDPMVMLENLDNLVFGHSTTARSLDPEKLEAIQVWLDDDSREQALLRLMKAALDAAGKTRKIPRATPEQIKIILESQEEVGVFWSEAQLKELTRWQADTIIKGLMVRSEVKRATGHYDYPIRRLRRAVRDELLGKPEEEVRGPKRDPYARLPKSELPRGGTLAV